MKNKLKIKNQNKVAATFIVISLVMFVVMTVIYNSNPTPYKERVFGLIDVAIVFMIALLYTTGLFLYQFGRISPEDVESNTELTEEK